MDTAILAYLGKLNIPVRTTKSGYMACCPGGTVSWHRAHSKRSANKAIVRQFAKANVDLTHIV